MISKAKAKLIRSLGQKKQRDTTGLFVAEGPKVVSDIMECATPTLLLATRDWLAKNNVSQGAEVCEVTDDELRAVSFLQHPQQVLAVFRQSDVSAPYDTALSPDSLYIALDGVQDPGNLGTIIRIADWFGIEHVFASPTTADVWNPKVVQATMGSIARVSVTYAPLVPLIERAPEGFPIYGTLLDGKDIHEAKLRGRGLLVMGNEANGITPDVARRVTERILIPNYPRGRKTADSLNVAIATAIMAYALRNSSLQ